MKQITSGKTKDCLADFFRRFGKSESLWKFSGASSDTETSWRLHGIMPYGDRLMRVQYFLDMVGYHVEELHIVTPELFGLGQCIAFNIITASSVGKELNTDAKHLYRYFRGENNPSMERNTAFAAIVSRNKVALNEAIFERRKELHSLSIAKTCLPALNGSDDALVVKFVTACARVRELGNELLNGHIETRFAMRRKMCEGPNPDLQCTWETLNNLLRERNS